MSYVYEHVTLLRVIDGDTIVVAIDVGFRFETTQTLRLLELNTPERGQPGCNEARTKLTQLLNSTESLKVATIKQDSFGRWLSRIYIDDGPDVSYLMRAWMTQQPWQGVGRD